MEVWIGRCLDLCLDCCPPISDLRAIERNSRLTRGTHFGHLANRGMAFLPIPFKFPTASMSVKYDVQTQAAITV